MDPVEQRLAECFRLLEETGNVERCLSLYPDLREEIEERLAIGTLLSTIRPPYPLAPLQLSSRRLMLTSLSKEPGERGTLGRSVRTRAGAALAALALLAVGAVGAGAAGGGVHGPGPVNDILSNVGIAEKAQSGQAADNHGSNVKDKVHEAIASATPGQGRGQAVSQAACEAAHDRTTLPTPAQNAPGQNGREPKDCLKTAEGQSGETDETPSDYGSDLSKSVHDAMASSTPGAERGQKVSEAACEAAHATTTLRPSVENAAGQESHQPKDCDHSNADGTPGAGTGTADAGTGKPSSAGSSTPASGKPATIPAGGRQPPNTSGQESRR